MQILGSRYKSALDALTAKSSRAVKIPSPQGTLLTELLLFIKTKQVNLSLSQAIKYNFTVPRE
ncbi:MAG: hypothetical protein GY928_33390 [Colwellia sp.]|nr:hypothetical protein [Colwellia sp.]